MMTNKPETVKRMTLAEWQAEGEKRFGENPLNWFFICPSCCHIASVQDWKDADARESAIAYACIGRFINDPKSAERTFKRAGGPCDYTNGGLINLSPVRVIIDDEEKSVFDFAEDL